MREDTDNLIPDIDWHAQSYNEEFAPGQQDPRIEDYKESPIPLSQVAVMGIMRGRYEDGEDAADHLLERR